jgi:hypothetical protein
VHLQSHSRAELLESPLADSALHRSACSHLLMTASASPPSSNPLATMAPKHGLASFKSEEEQLAKRAKSSATPASRSATPADPGAKVPFEVRYPSMDNTKNKTEEEEELVAQAEWQVSPFEAKGALREGELDQHFTVVPHHEWETMKKYNNFISEWMDRWIADRIRANRELQSKGKSTRTTNLFLFGARIHQRIKIPRGNRRTFGLRGYCKCGQRMLNMYMLW